ncbi:LysR type transcriptional regulator [Clostridiaceae bacterium JG1575]|nr:LysR type transcriptional regulator [Clostridiaceae bacterium JG1575]
MELKEQKYVVTLADIGNLTRAAGILGISQPALSLYIRNLENNLGKELFSRENRRMTPTYFGEVYINHARSILEIGKRFLDEMEYVKHGAKGKVTLGLCAHSSASVLPDILPPFQAQFPDVDIAIREVQDERDLEELLEDRKIDFALVDRTMPGYKTEIIKEEPVVLLVGEDSPLAQRQKSDPSTPISPGDLNHTRILMESTSHDDSYFVRYLKDNFGIITSQVLSLNSMDTILNLIRKNYGITLIPKHQLETLDLRGVTPFDVLPETSVKTLCVAFASNGELSDFAQGLLTVIEDVYGTPNRKEKDETQE